MGGIGPNFIDKQMRLLNIQPFDITKDDLMKLAWECRQNSTLLIGKKRADELYEELMALV